MKKYIILPLISLCGYICMAQSSNAGKKPRVPFEKSTVVQPSYYGQGILNVVWAKLKRGRSALSTFL